LSARLVVTQDRPAPPRHVAIVMDGNGRWAKKRFLPRFFGHKAGVDALVKIVQALAAQVAALSKPSGGRGGSRSRSHSRSRAGSRSAGSSNNNNNGNGDDGVCWYHRKFGADATKCTKPCNFKAGNGQGSA